MNNLNRKEIKAKGRKNLRYNYRNRFMVSIVLWILSGKLFYQKLGTIFLNGKENINTSLIRELLTGIVSNLTDIQLFIVGIANSFINYIFQGNITEASLILFSASILFIFWFFVENIIDVGICRFFVESINYENTPAEKIFFIYKVKRVLNVGKIMFLKTLYTFFWYLSIVGGPIKSYSYSMIPFILAENPDLNTKEVFKLSEKMMEGYKWKLFKLDISFIPLLILSIFTLDTLEYFYIKPYYKSVKAEIYLKRRNELILRESKYIEYFKDAELMNIKALDQYPKDKYFLPELSFKEIAINYKTEYSFIALLYIFISISVIGWIWEVSLHMFRYGNFINRGTLKGPWLPIYGTGGVLFLILLKDLFEDPKVFFLSAMGVAGILEYGTSWLLEKLYGYRWWNYERLPFNINGRISLRGLLFFAVGGSFIVYFLAPNLDNLIVKIPKKVKKIGIIIILIIFVLDVITSMKAPNQGSGITVSLLLIN